MSSEEIMRVLQDLFELGFITYHRTDSTRVSDAGMAVAREYITEKLGDKYFRPRRWGEGGAHECIRPTRPVDEQTLRDLINEGVIEPVRRLEPRHFAVYDMIFRRFMASQAAPARVARARLRANLKLVGYVGGERREVQVNNIEAGEVYVLGIEGTFDGYLRFYVNVPLIDRDTLRSLSSIVCKPPLPKEKGKKRTVYPCEIRLVWIGKEGTLLSEADAVRKMKERRIGRPSTYAKIMDTIKKRRYVEHNRVLVPTILGMEVSRYLLRKYGEFVTEEKTRELEERMRAVEEVGEDGYSLFVKLLTDIFSEMVEIEKRMVSPKS
jgi:reverse gyrase